MVYHRPRETQSQLSAHSVAHVKQFNETRNPGLAKEDAISNLLNDAVTVHIDKESHRNLDDTE
jgi:hypothetical protein